LTNRVISDIYKETSNLTTNSSVFELWDDYGRYIYRVYEDKITANNITSGELISVIPNKPGYTYQTYSKNPLLLNNRYIILINQNTDNFSEQLEVIDLLAGTTAVLTPMDSYANYEISAQNEWLIYQSDYIYEGLTDKKSGYKHKVISLKDSRLTYEKEFEEKAKTVIIDLQTALSVSTESSTLKLYKTDLKTKSSETFSISFENY